MLTLYSFSEFYINNNSGLPEPYQILSNLSVLSDYNGADISCYGGSDADVVITPVYGMPPFNFQWDDPLLQTDSIATGLSAGMYHVTVSDDNGFTFIDSIEVTEPDSISIEYTTTNACETKNDGIIELTVSGGTVAPDYNFTWSTVTGSGIVSGQEDQYTLSGGTYNVVVTDANACSDIESISIFENAASSAATGVDITNDNTCAGISKTLTPTGGMLGFNAAWRWYSDGACSAPALSSDASYIVDPATTTTYWVRAEGDCDTTAAISVTVAVLEGSVAADSISKTSDNIAPGATVTLEIHGGYLGEGASWKWYLDAAATSSTGSDEDSLVVNPMVTTQYWARAEGTCNTTGLVTTIVTVSPLPQKPLTPVGVDTICQNAANQNFITGGAAGATTYIWTISPASAGTISGTGTTATVDWNANFYGDVTVTVTGENASGQGPVSDPIQVHVTKNPQTNGIFHIGNSWGH